MCLCLQGEAAWTALSACFHTHSANVGNGCGPASAGVGAAGRGGKERNGEANGCERAVVMEGMLSHMSSLAQSCSCCCCCAPKEKGKKDEPESSHAGARDTGRLRPDKPAGRVAGQRCHVTARPQSHWPLLGAAHCALLPRLTAGPPAVHHCPSPGPTPPGCFLTSSPCNHTVVPLPAPAKIGQLTGSCSSSPQRCTSVRHRRTCCLPPVFLCPGQCFRTMPRKEQEDGPPCGERISEKPPLRRKGGWLRRGRQSACTILVPCLRHACLCCWCWPPGSSQGKAEGSSAIAPLDLSSPCKGSRSQSCQEGKETHFVAWLCSGGCSGLSQADPLLYLPQKPAFPHSHPSAARITHLMAAFTLGCIH